MASKITRREALKTAAAAAIGGVAGTTMPGIADTQSDKNERKPNIIYIMADDLGYGDAGCYGQEVLQTPNMDRMAREGMKFTDAYAGSTVCAPSRSCLMTGYHTGRTRQRTNARIPLRPKDVTVAEVLKEQNYATGIFGKWGLGEPETTGVPNLQGFDEWFGYLNQGHAHNYYPEYLWRNQQKVELEGNLGEKQQQYSHDMFTAEGLDFIRRHQDEPFFLYMAYTLPHANNELGRETGNGMQIPDDSPYGDRDWPQPQKNHAAMITLLDYDLGQMLSLLSDLGIDEETIVFFTSDNGPHREGGAKPEFFNSNGPLRGIKRDLYEGGIRVPMIVRWPGMVEADSESDEPWGFYDFLPTAADIAGVEAPDGIDGISMLPAILGEQQKSHEVLYWEFLHGNKLNQAVRMGEWKAVRLHPSEPLELYNLADDIGEQNDVAAQHPQIVKQAEEAMAAEHTEWEHYPDDVPEL